MKERRGTQGLAGAATKAAVVLQLVAMLGGASCKRTEVVQGFPDSFVGVGLELRIESEYPVVVRTLHGGPAESAGMGVGDRIVAIDGSNAHGLTLGNAVMLLRGAPNSQVTLTTERAGQRVQIMLRRGVMQRGDNDYQATPERP
jgi:C-terminal processing protease CtpA/Prc